MTMTNVASAPRVLIAGFGDIGERVARLLSSQYAVTALIRNPERAVAAQSCGARVIMGELSDARSLAALTGLAAPFETIFHFAPPPAAGLVDGHTRNLLAMLDALATTNLPRRLIYISTTGVYGDCGGAVIDESRPTNPQTDRARRRVDAEQQMQKWAQARQVTLVILRAPGIYAIDRLPLARLKAGTPAIVADEDACTNHIHADDLAAAAVAALALTSSHTLNVVDDSELKMGDYFDLVADHFGLPRPPRISRQEAATCMSPALLSFMRESRRIQNARMKEVLGLRLQYPTVARFLRATGCRTG